MTIPAAKKLKKYKSVAAMTEALAGKKFADKLKRGIAAKKLRLKWKNGCVKCVPFEISVEDMYVPGARYIYGVDAFGSIDWSDERGECFTTKLAAKHAAESWLISQHKAMGKALGVK